METFIVYQMQIDKKEANAIVFMSTTVRKVEANSKEEAIGKFIIGTNSIKAEQKLNVECIKLSELAML